MSQLRLISLLVLLVIVFSIFFSVISLCEDIYSKFYELYRRTANLALRGIDVGELEKLLASALDYLEAGDLGEASRIILELERAVVELEKRADAILLEKNFFKYSAVAALLSIPVAIYLLLPRVYIHLWYTSRKRWLMTYEHSR